MVKANDPGLKFPPGYLLQSMTKTWCTHYFYIWLLRSEKFAFVMEPKKVFRLLTGHFLFWLKEFFVLAIFPTVFTERIFYSCYFSQFFLCLTKIVHYLFLDTLKLIWLIDIWLSMITDNHIWLSLNKILFSVFNLGQSKVVISKKVWGGNWLIYIAGRNSGKGPNCVFSMCKELGIRASHSCLPKLSQQLFLLAFLF